MNLQSDYQNFAQHWLSCCEVSANPNRPSDSTLSIVFHDLMQYPIDWVIFALTYHRRSNKYSPVVADIIQIIKDHSGQTHVSADEAWAIASESFDENKTVVWTAQIAQARAAAWNAYCEGGMIPARMAFKDAYTRILKTTHTAPVWTACFGSDKADRVQVVEQAVLKNLLPKTQLETLRIEQKPAEVSFLQLVDMSQSKIDKNAAKTNLSHLKSSLFAKDKSSFETELAVLRKNGKEKEADAVLESAKNLSEFEIAGLAKRLKRENDRVAHEALVKEQMQKMKERMTPEQRHELETALQNRVRYQPA